MKGIIGLFTVLLLAGCGGSSSNSDNNTDICQQKNVNAKIFCALQKDYLWYQDLPANIIPSGFTSPSEMLNAVRAPQDRFSYVLTAQEYADQYINATYFGYGFARQTVAKTAFLVSYVYADGSAALNGLRRGDKIIEIEGVSVAEWLRLIDEGIATEEEMFGENKDGVMRQFVWKKPSGELSTADFIKKDVTTNTVLHAEVKRQGDKRIGYLVFNSFIELSETELEQAFSYFKQQDVNEIVLDLRYNGGGLIRVANQLASQIALNNVSNKIFVKYQYNDKNSSKNNSALFSLGQGSTSLNLPRVVVLTTEQSCSASELVINSLQPFVDVVQIGDKTCGKPVGQQPVLIDGYVLFAINFQTLNGLDQGGYFNGLQPNCSVIPNLVGDWGTEQDSLLAEALYYLDHEQCSANQTASMDQATHRLSTTKLPSLGRPSQRANEF